MAVVAVSIAGTGLAAEGWLDWWLPAAFAAVAVVELGGVAVSIYADTRRQLGEQALAARLLSAAVAIGAVAIQFFGHPEAGPKYFFSGMSVLGYCLYLLDSGARRRDALRDQGKLADTPPSYGMAQWIAHPRVTHRARQLFLANAEARLKDRAIEELGRFSSLEAARDQIQLEHRLANIRVALNQRIGKSVDPLMSKIAVNVVDLPRVSSGLIRKADHGALVDLLADGLEPAKIIKGNASRQPAKAPSVPKPPKKTGRQSMPGRRHVVAVPAAPEMVAVAADAVPEAGGEATGPGIPENLRPYLKRVMTAHADWPVAIGMPPKHPDALNLPKIMKAAGIGGKGLALKISKTLTVLADDADRAERELRITRTAAHS